MSSYRSLVEKYRKTKRELRVAESTIRRITGRDPDEYDAPSGSKFRPRSAVTRPSRPRYRARKPYTRYETSDSSASAEEDNSPIRHTLQSTVVAKTHEQKSRTDKIEELNANSKFKARNRRMFGALMGTLEKFKTEEKERQNKVSMRAEIEKKVEKETEEEKERLKKEKEALFVARKEKQAMLDSLQKKMERVEPYETFEANHHNLQNFIMTKTKPQIFYLPVSHIPKTRRALEDSRSKMQGIMKKHKESFDSDLSQIDEVYQKTSVLLGDKENKLPKVEEDPSKDPSGSQSQGASASSEPMEIEDDSSPLTYDDNESCGTRMSETFPDEEFEPIYD